jgi:PAS domain S-box-containing protein
LHEIGDDIHLRPGTAAFFLDRLRTAKVMKAQKWSNMRAFAKKWISPPVFEGDEFRTAQAKVLNSTTITTILFIVLALIGNSWGGRTPANITIMDSIGLAAVALLHVLLRRGNIAVVGIALSVLGFIGITAVNISLGTIRSPTIGFYLFSIITAGLIFGSRGILLCTLASSLAIAGLIVAENAGILPAPDYAVTITQWFSYTVQFGLTAGLISYTIQTTNKALARAETEIKERRHAEAELRKLTRAVEQSPASIVITDLAGRIEYANSAFSRITGYSLDEAIGKNPRILKSGQTPPEIHRQLWDALMAGKEWRGEFINKKKDGSVYYESAIISALTNMDGAKAQYLAVKEDITERRRSEQALEKAFLENSALLQELQHRAKNSFNMISAMIQLARQEGCTSETIEALDQLNSRVLSVAELYSLLYSSGSFAEVRLDEYCGKLARALLGLRADISLVTEMEEVVVSANRAAPIGLIVTELITNSLKYAFPGRRKGTVWLSLRKGPELAILEVRDDGMGLPSGFSPSGSSGMGLKLVTGLAKEAGARFAMAGSPGGTSCFLEFAADALE